MLGDTALWTYTAGGNPASSVAYWNITGAGGTYAHRGGILGEFALRGWTIADLSGALGISVGDATSLAQAYGYSVYTDGRIYVTGGAPVDPANVTPPSTVPDAPPPPSEATTGPVGDPTADWGAGPSPTMITIAPPPGAQRPSAPAPGGGYSPSPNAQPDVTPSYSWAPGGDMSADLVPFENGSMGDNKALLIAGGILAVALLLRGMKKRR